MSGLINFFLQAKGWIYFIAGIILVISIISSISLGVQRRKAIFGLEQEIAARKVRGSIAMIVLPALMILAELFFTSWAAVKYPATLATITPVAELQPTATSQIGVVESTGSAKVAATSVNTQGWTAGVIEWSKPKAGEQVAGSIELTGTVNVPDLGFYKFEYQAVAETNWITIAGANAGVTDGPLGGTWNTSNLTAGDYRLRLVVYDNQNNEYPECVITVSVAVQ